MILQKLLEGLCVKEISGNSKVEMRGVAYDSRLVKKDFVFVGVRGFSVDGHSYIKDAISRGATAIVGENAVDKTVVKELATQQQCTYVEVADSRKALALISDTFYGHPSKSLSMIGITGTNGKTTTSYITKSIIEANGKSAGLIGTICYMTGESTTAAVNTTPESLDLQMYLSAMVSNNMNYAVVEVSSHALALKRVEGCSFNVAAFTNFSQDHLDFHKTMDEYFEAKRGLFKYLDSGGYAVLNADDHAIMNLADKLDCNVITCGTGNRAMLRAENIKEYREDISGQMPGKIPGMSFDVKTPDGTIPVESEFMGRFNVNNILMSVGIAYALGISSDVIRQGIRSTRHVDGRFEKIDEGQNFLCIVDYAHTEDALEKLIEAARPVTTGRVITVFGCGGDRDITKRPHMGMVATEKSDFVIITSDNPRSESPEVIVRDIVGGIKKSNFKVQHDRAEAIKEAVMMAEKGDTLLVAGKGHEDYQDINGIRYHFSDKEILRNEIRGMLKVNK